MTNRIAPTLPGHRHNPRLPGPQSAAARKRSQP